MGPMKNRGLWGLFFFNFPKAFPRAESSFADDDGNDKSEDGKGCLAGKDARNSNGDGHKEQPIAAVCPGIAGVGG